MFTKNLLFTVASASAAAAAAAATTFDAAANTNMAVYWGQGPNQQRLAHFCADSSIDIIPIAFLNVFPDQANGGYPGTNFGNQCGPETFKNKDGSDSPLLSNCPFIGPDIKTCQALGKKVLLSLGGAIPTTQSIKNDESAVAFARFLWNAFGPEDATYDGPRPFGDAVIDGFDFDIESEITGNDPASQYRGYGTMINTLRVLFAADTNNQYYISASPQCIVPDAHLAQPIETAWFDFLFIQFYNTPQCSARAYFDASYGRAGDKPSSISFDAWVDFVRTKALNKDVKLYIGLPAAPLPALAYDTYMYLPPDDVFNLIDLFQCRYPKEFGGIMVFEATYSEQNLIENKPFVDVIKGLLTENKCAKPATSTSSTVSSTATPSSLSVTSSTQASSSPTSASASITGVNNSTFTAGPTAPIGTGSSSIPSYNSTGVWNGTSSSTVMSGTGSSSIPPYSTSTVIWNGTSSSTTILGTGPSSIPTYPTSTGIWNGTSTSSTIVGTGSSLIPPYPTSTGIWNATTSVLPSGTGYTSSSALVNSSTSISSHVSTSSSASDSSSVSTNIYSATTISLHPTGGSSGFPTLISATSVPYPTDNSTSLAQISTSSGVIYTTETITVTQCPPEVTSCPVRTSVTIYPITSSASHPVISSSDTPVISSKSAPITSVPTNSPETTTALAQPSSTGGVILTTETITITQCPPEVTSCPVRTSVTVYPITSSASPSGVSSSNTPVVSSNSAPFTSVPTNSPESTTASAQPSPTGGVILTTETITITKRPPEATSCPVRTSITIYPVTSSSSAPVTSAPVNSPETTSFGPSHGGATTLIVTTYVTTCPVTNTITTGGSTIIQTTSTVSTVTSTITSIFSFTATPALTPANPNAPETTPASTEHAVVPIPSPGHGGSSNPASPPSSSNNSPVGNSGSHPVPQPQQPANGGSQVPAHGSSSNPGSSPSGNNANSPVGGANIPGSSNDESSSPSSPPSSNSGNSPSKPQQPAPGSPSPNTNTPPTGNNANSPVNEANNTPAQGSSSPSGLSTIQNTSTKFLTSTVPASPAESGLVGSSGTASLPVIITQTLVPIPLNPEQTAQPSIQSLNGPEAFTSAQPSDVPSSAPFPVNNATATVGGSNGAIVSAPSASGTGVYSPGNVTPFTGGAGKLMGSSVLAVAVFVVGALLI